MEKSQTHAAILRLGDIVYILDDASGHFGDAAVVFRLLRDAGSPPGPPLAMKTWSSTPPPVGWLVWCSMRLEPFMAVPGMMASDRRISCLQSPVGLADAFAAGGTAITMPWIEGPSFADLVRERRPLMPSESLAAAASLASTLEALEEQGAWHGAVTESHVMLPIVGRVRSTPGDRRQAPVELVGLEAFHGLGWPDRPPADVPLTFRPPLHGISGHSHPDRFPGAVQIALLLGWCDDRVRALSHGETFFAEEELQRECPRFLDLLDALRSRWGEALADFLASAWGSRSSAECPSFEEWTVLLRALSAEGDQEQTVRALGPCALADPRDVPPTPPPLPPRPTASEPPRDPGTGLLPPPPALLLSANAPAAVRADSSWGSSSARKPRDFDDSGPKTLILDGDRRSRRHPPAAPAEGGDPRTPPAGATGPGSRTTAPRPAPLTRAPLVVGLVLMMVVLAVLLVKILASGSSPAVESPATTSPAGTTAARPPASPEATPQLAPSTSPGSASSAPSPAVSSEPGALASSPQASPALTPPASGEPEASPSSVPAPSASSAPQGSPVPGASTSPGAAPASPPSPSAAPETGSPSPASSPSRAPAASPRPTPRPVRVVPTHAPRVAPAPPPSYHPPRYSPPRPARPGPPSRPSVPLPRQY